jgi:hypothetical protein
MALNFLIRGSLVRDWEASKTTASPEVEHAMGMKAGPCNRNSGHASGYLVPHHWIGGA